MAVTNNINKLTDGNKIDLGSLSVAELMELHFNEECFCAEQALSLPPFSVERNKLLSAGYDLVHRIMDEISIRNTG